MALKSSQPRRSASLKSERLILRTTKAVETPNTCSLGLANTVAMAPVSLWSQGNGAPSKRAHPPRPFQNSVARYLIEANQHSRLDELCLWKRPAKLLLVK